MEGEVEGGGVEEGWCNGVWEEEEDDRKIVSLRGGGRGRRG